MNLRAFACGIAGCGLLASCAGPLGPDARPESAQEQQLVSLYFSADAWGGLPFSRAEKQQVIAAAMLSGERSRLEREVAYVPDDSGVRVRRFAAVYEVGGSVRPPTLRSGYELELLTPQGEDSLEVELINGETGVTNLVRIPRSNF